MKILRLLLLTATLWGCWSCSSGDKEEIITPTPQPETTKIEISSTEPVIEQAGGTATVSFTTNAAWTASVGASTSWVTVSPTDGEKGTNILTVATTENDTYDERNASVTIKAGNVSKNFTVTQKQKDALTVTSNKVELSADGGDFSIEAKANVSVSVEIEESAKEWIVASESRGLTVTALKFTAKANESEERRQGTITLKGGDNLTETVTVYQEGTTEEETPTLVVSTDTIVASNYGETIKIELQSNIDYEIVLPNVDWITRDESRALSSYTHYLIIAPNETYDSRSAYVFFNNATLNVRDTVYINQLQQDALILDEGRSEYIVSGEKNTLAIPVSSNVDYQVDISVDWITLNESRGMSSQSLVFDIAENPEEEKREGNITFSYQNLIQSVNIIQEKGIDKEAIEKERNALIALYNATNGSGWNNRTNWGTNNPLSEWYGIRTDENGRVYEINLNNNNLSGFLPNEISYLKKLQELSISDNEIGGELPDGFYELENLRHFYAYNANFEGKISSKIGQLKKLWTFIAANNKFVGPLPNEIGEIPHLYTIDLRNNPLACNFPISICSNTELETLYLSECGIYGNIPTEIGNLTNLIRLELENNKLSGTIPSTIGNLEKLESFKLHNNQLTGSIPGEIVKLTALNTISLCGNKDINSIPEDIRFLPCWQYMWLNVVQETGISIANLIDKKLLPGPTFKVKDLNGQTIDSSNEYKYNKLTVLIQLGDHYVIGDLIKVYQRYVNKNLEIIGWCNEFNYNIWKYKIKTYPWKTFITSQGNTIDKYSDAYPSSELGVSGPCIHVVDSNNHIIFSSLVDDITTLPDFIAKQFGDPEWVDE